MLDVRDEVRHIRKEAGRANDIVDELIAKVRDKYDDPNIDFWLNEVRNY